MTDTATVEKVARAIRDGNNWTALSAEQLALASIAAYEQAIKDAGMVVVPREPTEAMVWAGDEAAQTCIVDDPCGKAGAHVWADMIAASEAADLASARGRG